MRAFSCLIICLVAACAPKMPPPPNQAPLVLAYAQADTEKLWALQASTSDPLQLWMVEAELGSREQFESGDRYLGSRTRSSVGSYRYTRSAPTLYNKNCSDFASPASAQRFFLSAGGPVYDPHGLDRDGDGNACEWGTKLREISLARIAPVAQPTPTIRRTTYYESECYVGPRGGTYTITASGNKNYDGC